MPRSGISPLRASGSVAPPPPRVAYFARSAPRSLAELRGAGVQDAAARGTGRNPAATRAAHSGPPPPADRSRSSRILPSWTARALATLVLVPLFSNGGRLRPGKLCAPGQKDG